MIHVQIDPSFDLPIYFIGPSLKEKKVPTFLYFSISGQESLALAPYNQIADLLYQKRIRVISWTLPGHHEGQDKHTAMTYWIEHLDELRLFLQQSHQLLDTLFENQIIDSKHFALGGLSRGGFVATHLLSHPKVRYAVGLAPLVDLRNLSEGKNLKDEELEGLQLEKLHQKLYSKSLYYLIGNRDERVSTDKVFQWYRTLVDYAYDQRIRSPHIEMKIFPSVGYQGHGSLPFVFQEAAQWVEKQIER